VAVTKGPEFEIPAEVGARAHRSLTVVMSTEAWSDYEVPGSPFFVLVDGRTGRRVGEGVANQFSQVAELVRRAQGDVRPFDVGSRSRAFAEGLDGPARERANDDALWPPVSSPATRASTPRPWPTCSRPMHHLAGGCGAEGSLDGHPQRARDLGGTAERVRRPDLRPTRSGRRSLLPGRTLRLLPAAATVGDFGSGAVTMMGPSDVFAVLFQYGPRAWARHCSPPGHAAVAQPG